MSRRRKLTDDDIREIQERRAFVKAVQDAHSFATIAKEKGVSRSTVELAAFYGHDYRFKRKMQRVRPALRAAT